MKKLKYFLLTKSLGKYINLLNVVNPKKAGLLGFDIFCKPRAGKLKSQNLTEILQTAQIESFEYEEIVYYNYVWTGNNKIILLLHGWESNSSRWERLLPFLFKTGCTVVALDAPAHGLSGGNTFTVPYYTKVARFFTQKYNPTIIIGHSIGGFTAIYYQYLTLNPTVEKLIILGAPSNLNNLVDNYCKLLGLNLKSKRQLIKTFAEQLQIDVNTFSTMEFAKNIQAKVLVVHDRLDSVVTFAEAEKTIISWINATFIETTGLGHSLHDNDLYDKIVDFIIQE